jgi:hypothetical protein
MSLGTPVFLAAFCSLTIFGVMLVFIVLVIRKVVSHSGAVNALEDRPPRPAVRPRIVADGFWLRSSSIRTGSNVRYRYRAGDATRTGEVAYEPGPEGLFIYTGEQPEDIEILEVRPPKDSGTGAADLDWDTDTGTSPDIDALLRSEPGPGAALIDALPADDIPSPSDVPSDWSSSEPPAY